MSDSLKKLLQGMVAATHLLDKAYEKQSALESIVLQTNLIDGALRLGLILKAQLDSGTQTIDESLLIQNKTNTRIADHCDHIEIDKSGMDDGHGGYTRTWVRVGTNNAEELKTEMEARVRQLIRSQKRKKPSR